jgi:hypothetical protein
MTDIPVQTDVETVAVDVLAAALADEDVTVSVGVPADWTPDSLPHIEVRHDGTPDMTSHPVAGLAVLSLIARARKTSDAKRWASVAQSILCDSHDQIGALALTGVLPARDPETRAELASTTVEVVARFTLT